MTILNYLKKKNSYANFIYNDINQYLFNLYYNIQNNPNEMLEYIKKYNTHDYINSFKTLVNICNNTENITEQSAIYLLLNYISYNNYVYYNNKNKITISSLNHILNKKKIIVDINKINISEISDFLANVELICNDILEDSNH